MTQDQEQLRELEDRFGEAQQRLIDLFKVKLMKSCDEVLAEMYQDVTNYAASDAHTNYHNYLRDALRDQLTKEIASEHGMYSWAHSIRMTLLKNHREEIQNKIIEDLEAKVERLQAEIRQIHERMRY